MREARIGSRERDSQTRSSFLSVFLMSDLRLLLTAKVRLFPSDDGTGRQPGWTDGAGDPLQFGPRKISRQHGMDRTEGPPVALARPPEPRPVSLCRLARALPVHQQQRVETIPEDR